MATKAHKAEETIFLRCSAADKAMVLRAVARFNVRTRGIKLPLTLQDFVVEAALKAAKRVLAPSVQHVTGRGRT